jgi:poly(3-hydroxybutyrate) depolymerase
MFLKIEKDKIFCPWSPNSTCSTVATDADIEQARGRAGSNMSNYSLDHPLLSELPTERRRPYVVFALISAALVLGILIGTCGTLALETPGMMLTGDKAPHLLETPKGHRTLFKVFNRDVWVYQSAKASTPADRHLPAVLVLHGSEDYPLSIAERSGFEKVAETASEPFLAVFPSMDTPGGESWLYDKDLPFFRAVIDLLDREYSLKRDEVYVCGHSAGGTMSLYLQNNMPDAFRGVASIEAGVGHELLWNMSSFGRPTMLVMNQNDPVLKDYDVRVEDTVKTLRRHDSMASGPSFISEIPVHSSVRYAKKITWGAVGSTPPTVAISFETYDATHIWSNPKNIPGSFDAAAMVWDFFSSIRAFEPSKKLT